MLQTFDILLPIGLLIIQNFLLIIICMAILKRSKLLKAPFVGMEFSQLILAAAFLLGVFLIATADVTELFQAFKTFKNDGTHILSKTISKFSQFFIMILLFEILFSLICFLIARLISGFKKPENAIEDDIPTSILIGVSMIGFALLLQPCTKEIIETITPQYLNFR